MRYSDPAGTLSQLLVHKRLENGCSDQPFSAGTDEKREERGIYFSANKNQQEPFAQDSTRELMFHNLVPRLFPLPRERP